MTKYVTENTAAHMLHIEPWRLRDLVDEGAINGMVLIGAPGVTDGESRIVLESVTAFKDTPRHKALLAAKAHQDKLYGGRI